MAQQVVMVFTTLPLESDVLSFANALIEERVVACVTAHQHVKSVYRWSGEIKQEQEQQIVFKTTLDRVEKLWEQLQKLHPYEVPEFVVLPVMDGSTAYLNWIRESTKSGEDD